MSASAVALASASASAAATVALLAVWVRRMRPPVLHFSKTAANERLLRAIPLLHRAYVPNLFAWNAHLAGFFGYVKLPVRRRGAPSDTVVTLPDGGCVSLCWSSTPTDGKPLVLLLPGINNDAAMPYIQHLMSAIEAAGIAHAAALNWRGLGGLPLTATTGTPRPYSGHGASDVASVISHLRRRLPHSPLFAVGWSLGGNILVRYLGEAGSDCPLRGAMAVSPAMDLSAGLHKMERSAVGTAYLMVITAPLLAYFFRHRAAVQAGPNGLSFRHVVASALFARGGLDEHVFAPLCGLSSREEYHSAASAASHVDRVAVPLLVVHAEDDPVVPVASLPLQAMAANPHIVTALTRHGGHMGFTAGWSPLGHTWTDLILLQYLRHLLGSEMEGGGDAYGPQHRAPAPAPPVAQSRL